MEYLLPPSGILGLRYDRLQMYQRLSIDRCSLWCALALPQIQIKAIQIKALGEARPGWTGGLTF